MVKKTGVKYITRGNLPKKKTVFQVILLQKLKENIGQGGAPAPPCNPPAPSAGSLLSKLVFLLQKIGQFLTENFYKIFPRGFF